MRSKPSKAHQHIIYSAIPLIRQSGFDNVSIDAICKQASISRSTFYNHFTSKEHLVFEYILDIMVYTPELIAWIHDAPTAYERVVRVQLSYILYSKDSNHLELCNIYLRHLLTIAAPERLSVFDDRRVLMLPLIRQAQEAGEILSTDSPEILCEASLVLNLGNLVEWVMTDASFDRISAHIQSLEVLFNVRPDLRNLERLYKLSLPTFPQI